ncbi:2',3'-cyclic-nucleotide 3'-phosphodiesterase-like [Argiope bruennichi]|uniref:2',3'-cyclic-nucleotide 3'-phosphodiesterase-like n=1 Tax=Argiope bruennichi TaxID=94029 RepID=UPI0024947068|nr:2',3'-cyclic-nucleotide 3'-phosphodiesterase-like [Argiope bruennichi]XP_055951949.1 2',3'-cyclic-nucleotide 3'-phosphodiesterase-like [Argiope bruennichi]XP_055951950.1 2',3'-cyclic-nucleotide 3'-phosphodiesterase-like [Argiope bruennichi]
MADSLKDYKKSDISAETIRKLARLRKKFMLGSDVDKDLVFDFQFLMNEETVSYIQKHGKVMFLIRGPPSTGKATLSEMIIEKYPKATFCCADLYFKNSFNSPSRTKESLRLSHEFCASRAETACTNDSRLIIIQNTHMRKWEMQHYLNLAATNNYVVIMAITLYRFEVTPEALLANNTDGLNITYFRKRLRQWEDIPPALTGWFLCPEDASYLQSLALESLKGLTADEEFCHIFELYSSDKVAHYYKARRLLFCLAAYATDSYEMKNHYLSDIVQYLYGKCFTITVLGYHITPSAMNAVVYVDDKMELLMFEGSHNYVKNYEFSDYMNRLGINDNLSEHGKTYKFKNSPQSLKSATAALEEWEEGEVFFAKQCSFIHLAQKDEDVFDAGQLRNEFKKSILFAADVDDKFTSDCFNTLNNGTTVCRVKDNEWLIKAPKKISFKALFTGLYT